MIRIYTDGACSNNQSDINFGGWGAVLIYGNHIKKIYGGEKNTTNNRMELKAVINALEILKRKDIPVEIFTDSAYIVNCFKEEWYKKWIINNWERSKKESVLNRDLWEKLIELYKSLKQVKFSKIKAHIDPEDTKKITMEYEKYKKNLNKNLSDNSEKTDYFMSFIEYKEHIKYNNEADSLAVLGAKEIEEGEL